MRTTITLDEDMAAKLRAEARRLGRSFREIANDAHPSGLGQQERQERTETLPSEGARPGRSPPGVSLDNFGDLLEQLEGPLHR
jgi:hypothetical protein